MDFIDLQAVDAVGPLKAAHYPFPRAEQLHGALSWCLSDYAAKAASHSDFEARGILVTGQSRVGKTREIKRLVAKFNAANVQMPNCGPARIVHCILSGKVTWKDLGVKTLEALGYPLEGRRTQTYIWDMVIEQARRQNVIGIHYDECQHVFTEDGAKTNRIFLDSFKTLLKDSRWPLVLILSGVPALEKHINQEEQLRFLLRPVHFDLIKPVADIEELNGLAYSYADKAGIAFDTLSNVDFFERLCFASMNRWGLAIELVIEALTICKMSGSDACTIDHFCEAFTRIHGLRSGFSPFTVTDYRDCFDQDSLFDRLP